MKIEKYYPLHILCGNGWKWVVYDKDKDDNGDEYEQYKATFLGKCYSSVVTAVVSACEDHLNYDGHYGVLWLQAEYECELPYTYDDLEDMQMAIVLAEENLIRIGMPFTPEYKFHGRNAANLKRRNEKLRRVYDLERLEREGEEQ